MVFRNDGRLLYQSRAGNPTTKNMKMIKISKNSIAVDKKKDLKKVRKILKKNFYNILF